MDYFNGIRIPFSENKFKVAVANDTLLCIEGGSAGRKIAILEQDVCFVNKLCAFHSLGINPKYLYYFLQSPQFRSVFKENTSGLIGGVSVNTLKKLLILVPPIMTQKKIVKKIEELFMSFSDIEQSLS